jgi:Multicopper oxidase
MGRINLTSGKRWVHVMLLTTTFHTNHAIGQAGTFWYHSHISTQYCDGLRGPLVVYDPQDPHADLYDIDDGQHFLLIIKLFVWCSFP